MPPKKGAAAARPTRRTNARTPATVTQHPIDAPRFISPAAEQTYLQKTVKRGFVEESGFETTTEESEYIVEDRNWQAFTAQPEDAIPALVREFYANLLHNSDDELVYVRGIQVPFSQSTINEFYGTDNLTGETEFEHFIETDLDYADMAEHMCRSPPEWTVGEEQKLRHFKANALALDSYCWFRFAIRRLMPSSHLTSITLDQMVLIYAICMGIPIDIGRIIYRGILQCASGSHNDTLHFPHLITALCLRAGVPRQPFEEILPPAKCISSFPRRPDASAGARPALRPPRQRPLFPDMTQLAANLRAQNEGFHLTLQAQSRYLVNLGEAQHQWFGALASVMKLPGDAFIDAPQIPPGMLLPSDDDEDASAPTADA